MNSCATYKEFEYELVSIIVEKTGFKHCVVEFFFSYISKIFYDIDWYRIRQVATEVKILPELAICTIY